MRPKGERHAEPSGRHSYLRHGIRAGRILLSPFFRTKQLKQEMNHRKDLPMWDIGCIAASTIFFAIAIAYIFGCDRLDAKESK
jgi:hypothetical protein